MLHSIKPLWRAKSPLTSGWIIPNSVFPLNAHVCGTISSTNAEGETCGSAFLSQLCSMKKGTLAMLFLVLGSWNYHPVVSGSVSKNLQITDK